jgi:hypothetical protein
MAAGQPPVILQRVLYYEAPHFAGMFDRYLLQRQHHSPQTNVTRQNFPERDIFWLCGERTIEISRSGIIHLRYATTGHIFPDRENTP